MSSMRSASSSTNTSSWLQIDEALAGEVEQAARRGDEDVDAVLQRLLLRVLADAAEDHRRAQRQVRAVGREALADLRGELARRREHEAADVAVAACRGAMCARRWRIGSANAAVLPVPVWARPSRSRPASTCGIARAWIGVGVDVALRRDRLRDRRDQAQLLKLHRGDIPRSPQLLQLFLQRRLHRAVEAVAPPAPCALRYSSRCLVELRDLLLGLGALRGLLGEILGRARPSTCRAYSSGSFASSSAVDARRARRDRATMSSAPAAPPPLRDSTPRGRPSPPPAPPPRPPSCPRSARRTLVVAVDDGRLVDLAAELGELVVVGRRDLLDAAVLADRRELAVAERSRSAATPLRSRRRRRSGSC